MRAACAPSPCSVPAPVAGKILLEFAHHASAAIEFIREISRHRLARPVHG
jgi:hypothetical protein